MHRAAGFENFSHSSLLAKHMSFYLVNGGYNFRTLQQAVKMFFQKVSHTDCAEFALLIRPLDRKSVV